MSIWAFGLRNASGISPASRNMDARAIIYSSIQTVKKQLEAKVFYFFLSEEQRVGSLNPYFVPHINTTLDCDLNIHLFFSFCKI
jgi:hypothetical protein